MTNLHCEVRLTSIHLHDVRSVVLLCWATRTFCLVSVGSGGYFNEDLHLGRQAAPLVFYRM